jgi:hypothetical protein
MAPIVGITAVQTGKRYSRQNNKVLILVGVCHEIRREAALSLIPAADPDRRLRPDVFFP